VCVQWQGCWTVGLAFHVSYSKSRTLAGDDFPRAIHSFVLRRESVDHTMFSVETILVNRHGGTRRNQVDTKGNYGLAHQLSANERKNLFRIAAVLHSDVLASRLRQSRD
jgi:hypothetical protein